jgi:hypothetical protein
MNFLILFVWDCVTELWEIILAMSQQNQHSGFATSMDPDQPAHWRSLIRINAFRLPTLLQV